MEKKDVSICSNYPKCYEKTYFFFDNARLSPVDTWKGLTGVLIVITLTGFRLRDYGFLIPKGGRSYYSKLIG